MIEPLCVLDLFSGIGGFSLGLERAGMKTVAFCEIDPFCRRVLAKHWPEIPCYEDVRSLTANRLRADGIAAEIICGGFPCQDISYAGKGAGIEGERSGLWAEYARIIGELRPLYVIVENVSALLGRGIDRVLGDLAALGYDAEWHCIPASAVGAPHRRDRVWIVAYPARFQPGRTEQRPQRERARPRCQSELENVADAFGKGLGGRPVFAGYFAAELAAVERNRAPLSDADGAGRSQQIWTSETVYRAGQSEFAGQERCGRNPWLSEPDVGRVANGVPARVDRLRTLGNAVVSQIPEIIGRAIMEARAA